MNHQEATQHVNHVAQTMVTEFWVDKDPVQLAQEHFQELLIVLRTKDPQQMRQHAYRTTALCVSNTAYEREWVRCISFLHPV
jgi:hypothetical protein